MDQRVAIENGYSTRPRRCVIGQHAVEGLDKAELKAIIWMHATGPEDDAAGKEGDDQLQHAGVDTGEESGGGCCGGGGGGGGGGRPAFGTLSGTERQIMRGVFLAGVRPLLPARAGRALCPVAHSDRQAC